MNEANFYNSFQFNVFEFKNHHLTDNLKNPIPRHYFGYLINGTARIKSNNEEIELKANDIFYIPKGLRYQSSWFGGNNNEIKFYSFGFEFSPIKKSFILQKINCNDKTKEIFKELCENINSPNKAIGTLYYFFEKVYENMIPAKKTHIHPIIEKATEYISQNPNAKISEIARYCNISEPSIYSLFKKYLNKSPNEVKNRLLCRKAVLLLTTTNKSVEEISNMLGFSSTSYFRKTLKTYIGKKPLEIRKESVF